MASHKTQENIHQGVHGLYEGSITLFDFLWPRKNGYKSLETSLSSGCTVISFTVSCVQLASDSDFLSFTSVFDFMHDSYSRFKVYLVFINLTFVIFFVSSISVVSTVEKYTVCLCGVFLIVINGLY